MKYTIETKEPNKVSLSDVPSGSIFKISSSDNLYMKLDKLQFDKTLKEDCDIESYFDQSACCPIINISNGKLFTMDFLDYVYPVENYEFKISI